MWKTQLGKNNEKLAKFMEHVAFGHALGSMRYFHRGQKL
jgi:hypothetical protein